MSIKKTHLLMSSYPSPLHKIMHNHFRDSPPPPLDYVICECSPYSNLSQAFYFFSTISHVKPKALMYLNNYN